MCGSVKDTGCGQGILDSSQSHGFFKLGELLILYSYTGPNSFKLVMFTYINTVTGSCRRLAILRQHLAAEGWLSDINA